VDHSSGIGRSSGPVDESGWSSAAVTTAGRPLCRGRAADDAAADETGRGREGGLGAMGGVPGEKEKRQKE